MPVTVTYTVDQDLYHKADVKHDITLVTTQYRYGTDLLAHILFGENVNVRLNNGLSDLLEAGSIPQEQFFSQKSFNSRPRTVTRGAFEAKMKRFDLSQTAVEREILEEYGYIGADGLPERVQIAMTDGDGVTAAKIIFEDAGQYENFPCPAWLEERTLSR